MNANTPGDPPGPSAADTAELIPGHWSPEQALAVFDFLADLTDAIWIRHETALVEHCIRQIHSEPARDAFEPDEPDFDPLQRGLTD
ncbi:MAG: hypothetical protein HOI95_16960 [Chromatiales bacterium]|jgi:hypothetical protein|nr:hypothetical protein [Chromatiales bacterium]